MREVFFRILPWLVLVLSLAVTVDVWRQTRSDVERIRSEHFDSLMRETAVAIRDRLDSYRDANLGGVGLFNASEDVTRDEWRDYQTRLDLPRRHAGAQGLGFAMRGDAVPKPGAVSDARSLRRADRARNIHPRMPLEPPYVITYADPLAPNSSAVGFDAGSVAELRRAMERAASSGKSTLTERVVFERNRVDTVFFVLFTPVYANGTVPDSQTEREADVIGWVYAPFDANAFVGGLFESVLEERDPHIDLAIYSSSSPDPDHLLYRDLPSFAHMDPAEIFVGRSGIRVYGEPWTIEISANPSHEFFNRQREASAVLVAGLVSSLLLFAVIQALNRRRLQAVALAVAMTDDLVLRASELRSTNEALEAAKNRAEAAANTLLQQHDSLARAERMAALGEMAGGMAHELRNPIAGMLMSLENLSRECEDESTQARLVLVTEELNRLTRLLNAYLAPARHNPEAIVETNVTTLIDDLCALVRYRLPVGIELVTSGSAQVVWEIPMDRIRQALLNLTLNSAQAIEEAAGDEPAFGRIQISCAVRDDALDLVVEDDGPGLPQALLDRPPQPFESSKIGGTGLGLAMVRRVVADLHGQLEIKNRSPHGAYIRIRVPKQTSSRI